MAWFVKYHQTAKVFLLTPLWILNHFLLFPPFLISSGAYAGSHWNARSTRSAFSYSIDDSAKWRTNTQISDAGWWVVERHGGHRMGSLPCGLCSYLWIFAGECYFADWQWMLLKWSGRRDCVWSRGRPPKTKKGLNLSSSMFIENRSSYWVIFSPFPLKNIHFRLWKITCNMRDCATFARWDYARWGWHLQHEAVQDVFFKF